MDPLRFLEDGVRGIITTCLDVASAPGHRGWTTARSIRSVDVCRFWLGNLVGGAVDCNSIPPTDGRSVKQIWKGWPWALLISWASVGDAQSRKSDVESRSQGSIQIRKGRSESQDSFAMNGWHSRASMNRKLRDGQS
jgi:hypothetical protein